MHGSPKVLVVGLDAADKNLLLQWADSGLLPTIARLRGESAWGVTLGPLGIHGTAVWESFATGVSPARHARHSERQIRTGTYETYRFMPTDLQCEAFWNPLSRAGKRVAVIDLPYVPLSEVNGVHVLDWMAHAANTGFRTWPRPLADQLRQQFGTDPIGLCDHRHLQTAAEFSAFRDQLVGRVATKLALCRQLLTQEAWDFFLAVFTEAHCVGHQCWHLHDATHPRHDPALARVLGDPIRDVYRALDAALGELLEAVGPQTNVFVVASHGMRPNYHGAHLLDAILHRLGHTPPPPQPRWQWQAVRWAWRQLPARWRLRLTPRQKRLIDRLWPLFDHRSNCFNVANGEVWGAIRVNLAGREPQGRIQPGADFERFCDTLAQDLCALINADTGEPAVLSVRRTAEIYHGPHLVDLPDLLVEWNMAVPLNGVSSPKTGVVRAPFPYQRTGHHSREGLWFVRGPGIVPGQLAEPVSVLDFAPTFGELLGVPLRELEGRPIAACAGRGGLLNEETGSALP
ncbi:MAG TPA: alkaline phosphatase family protein [Candidatus Kryptonia bacterium]|nr:alkaline phosphatase family protein [Candidatus Kryptonia bacterium]